MTTQEPCQHPDGDDETGECLHCGAKPQEPPAPAAEPQTEQAGLDSNRSPAWHAGWEAGYKAAHSDQGWITLTQAREQLALAVQRVRQAEMLQAQSDARALTLAQERNALEAEVATLREQVSQLTAAHAVIRDLLAIVEPDRWYQGHPAIVQARALVQTQETTKPTK